MKAGVFCIHHDYADVWVTRDDMPHADYAYGGTRMVPAGLPDANVERILARLMRYESAFKNHMINRALRAGAVSDLSDALPAGFVNSVVGGARCVIRPRTAEIAVRLSDPNATGFRDTLAPVFEMLGAFLNQRGGDIKLTPDFGRFAGLSDMLAEFTPHVLGIRRESGGCGGKSSYSTTGVFAALEHHGVPADKTRPVTLIGACGAMGSDVLRYLVREGYTDVAVCDLAYDDARPAQRMAVPAGVRHLASQERAFTDACLSRGGVIVATTVGEELERSNWQLIPAGTLLVLAHNLAIPLGPRGLALMDALARQGVYALPGQLLTLGGALTSRIEWFWRQHRSPQLFDKPLAHAVVDRVIRHLAAEVEALARSEGMTPYAATGRLGLTDLG